MPPGIIKDAWESVGEHPEAVTVQIGMFQPSMEDVKSGDAPGQSDAYGSINSDHGSDESVPTI